MKPEQFVDSFRELKAVPDELKLGSDVETPELLAAKNTLGRRLALLFDRVAVFNEITTEIEETPMYALGLVDNYTGPEAFVFGPEIKTYEHVEDQVGQDQFYDTDAISYREATFVRLGKFFLPILPKDIKRILDNKSSEGAKIMREVLIGYQRYERYETSDDQEVLDSVDYEVESYTYFWSDAPRLEDFLGDLLVKESTGDTGIFNVDEKLLNSRGDYDEQDLYETFKAKDPRDLKGKDLYKSRADELCEYRRDTASGFEILDSFNIGELEDAVRVIENHLNIRPQEEQSLD